MLYSVLQLTFAENKYPLMIARISSAMVIYYIVTYIPITRQRVGKHSRNTSTRDNITSIAR
jgi:hypothetical protein